MEILVLAPFAAVEAYHYPLMALARELGALGHRLTMVHCRRAMDTGCTAMNALNVSDRAGISEKAKVCARCIQRAEASERVGFWDTRWLEPGKEAGPVDFRRLGITPAQIRNCAAYELLLQRKAETIPRDSDFVEPWRMREKALRGILPQAVRILEEKKYQGLICYNSLYGIHRIFLEMGHHRGISTLSLHHSLNAGEEDGFVLFRDNVFSFLEELKRRFPRKGLLDRGDQEAIRRHENALFRSQKLWSYSTPHKKGFQGEGKKNFLRKALVCLSSPDEVFAARFAGVLPPSRKPAFADQVAWIRWVRQKARQHPETLFWIRPHPRLFPNRRERQMSSLGVKLEKERKKPHPANFFWPPEAEQGSVWQHLADTDVLLNAWSTLGEPFGRRGVPVMTFFPGYANSGDRVGWTARTPRGFSLLLVRLLRQPRAWSHAVSSDVWTGDYLTHNRFRLRIKPKWWVRVLLRLVRGVQREEFFLKGLIFRDPFGFTGRKTLVRMLANMGEY